MTFSDSFESYILIYSSASQPNYIATYKCVMSIVGSYFAYRHHLSQASSLNKPALRQSSTIVRP